jgi:hypothetical protein
MHGRFQKWERPLLITGADNAAFQQRTSPYVLWTYPRLVDMNIEDKIHFSWRTEMSRKNRLTWMCCSKN